MCVVEGVYQFGQEVVEDSSVRVQAQLDKKVSVMFRVYNYTNDKWKHNIHIVPTSQGVRTEMKNPKSFILKAAYYADLSMELYIPKDIDQ